MSSLFEKFQRGKKRKAAGTSCKTLEAIKDGPLRASLLFQEARLLLLEGHPDAAATSANQALAYWTFADHPRWKTFAHLVLAEIATQQHHDTDASEHAALSLQLYTQVGDQYGMEQACPLLANKPPRRSGNSLISVTAP